MEKLAKGYKIGVIGKRLLTTGFRLAGVKRYEKASTGEEAEAALRKLMQDEEIGIIIMPEGLASMIKDRKLLNAIDTSILPLIIQVPDYNEEERETDTIRRLVLRAVGIDIDKISKLKG